MMDGMDAFAQRTDLLPPRPSSSLPSRIRRCEIHFMGNVGPPEILPKEQSRRRLAGWVCCGWESRNSVLGILVVLEKPTLKEEEEGGRGAQRQSLKSGDRKEQLNTQGAPWVRT